MEFIRLLKFVADNTLFTYGKKIIGDLVRELDEFKVDRIMEENNLYILLNILPGDLRNLPNLNQREKGHLKKIIKKNKFYASSIFNLNPFINNENDLNKEFTEYKAYILNKLIENKELVIVKNKFDLNKLLNYQSEFNEQLDTYSRLNFPSKILINLDRLSKIFNKIYTIEKALNSSFDFGPIATNSPYLFKSLNEISQKTKIEKEKINEIFEENQKKFGLILNDFPFISKKIVFSNLDIMNVDLSNDGFNTLIKTSIPEELKTSENILDFSKINQAFLTNKILVENNRFFYFLKKLEIENDFFTLILIYYLSSFLNKNGFVKLNILIHLVRVGVSNFNYSIKKSIIFDLKELANPWSWRGITEKVLEEILKCIEKDSEKYDEEKDLFTLTIKSLDYEIYKKNDDFFVRGKSWFKKETNCFYNPKTDKGCLLLCVFKYFTEIGLIKNTLEEFVLSLSLNLQFYLITGDVCRSFEEISKIYKINLVCYKDLEVINYNKYTFSVPNEKFYFKIEAGHVSLILEKPKRKLFYLGKEKIKKNEKTTIISWDLETYTDDKYIFGNQTVYCICTYSDNKDYQKTFWGYSSVKNFIEWISTLKEKITFWSFNGSRFDNQFLIDSLLNKFGTAIKFVGNRLQKKQIKINDLCFNDFNCFFPGSLNSVCKNFGILGKEDFDISKITKENFELEKNDIIKYCIQDCRCLFECVNKFAELLPKIDLFNSLDYSFFNIATNSSLALNLVKSFLNSKKIYLKGSYGSLLDLEKKSYHGGVCVVFKKHFPKAYCYDINSSYPAALKKNLPYEVDFKFVYEESNYVMSKFDLITFDYELENNEFSIFAESAKDKSLIYVKKAINSVHWGIEVLFMIKNFKFKFLKIKNVIRYKKKKLFSELIDYFYKLRLEEKNKENRNDTLIEMYKLVLNSIYGKFGQRFFNKEKLCKKDEVSNLFNDVKEIDIINDKYVNVIFKEDLDYQCQIGSLVRIASFTCARAKINLFNPIMKIGFNHLAYVDTDSLFLDCELPLEFLDNSELGKFKLEYVCSDFYAVCPKVYGCKINGLEKIKMKSCKTSFNGENQINLNDIIRLSESDEEKISLQSLQFTRTRDNNIKILTIKKEIKNSSFKRIFNGNDSFMWDSVEDYLSFKDTIKKKSKKNESDDFETLNRKLLIEESVFLKTLNLQNLEKMIYHFISNNEFLNDAYLSKELKEKNDLLKKFQNILLNKASWFTWFLLTHNWEFDPLDFYNNNNLNATSPEIYWRDNLIVSSQF